VVNSQPPESDLERARHIADRLVETPGGRRMIFALETLLQAVECEGGINDDESDDFSPAQEAVIDAQQDLCAATGAEGVILRRGVAFVLDKSRVTDAEVERVLAGVEADPNAASESQRRIVRALAMRAVVDLRLLPRRVTAFPAWSLFLGTSGRKAAPDGGQRATGGVWAYVPTAGVNADDGPVEAFKSKLVDKVGYTAGNEGLRVTHRLTESILTRAVAEWNGMRRRSRYPLPPGRTRNIRKWCGLAGGSFKLNEQFERAYQHRVADHALAKADAGRLLRP
jgi:hypothetical protein